MRFFAMRFAILHFCKPLSTDTTVLTQLLNYVRVPSERLQTTCSEFFLKLGLRNHWWLV